MSPKYTLVLEKKTGRRSLDPDVIKRNMDYFVQRILTGGRGNRGWTASFDPVKERPLPEGGKTYTLTLTIQCTKPRQDPRAYATEFQSIRGILMGATNTPQGGKSPGTKWEIITVNGENAADGITSEVKGSKAADIGYVHIEIPRNPKSYFTELYDLEAHIEIVLEAIKAGIDSDWRNRFNVALIGPPACGKSSLCLAVEGMLGKESVLRYDATATTQAGIIKDLNERDELPRVMVVEEAEKADDNSLRWMLGVGDHRAEIRKTTAREKIERDVKMLIISTVNDYHKFRRVMDGALYSRHPHKLFFKKPTEELLKKILQREVEKVDGDPRWIDHAVRYCVEYDIYDPRQAIAICLTGQNGLLNGSFQKKLKLVAEPKEEVIQREKEAV